MLYNQNQILKLYLAKSKSIHIKRDSDGWIQKGDEEINNEMEETSMQAQPTKMPSKMKAVIKFGYDEGIKIRLGNKTFDDWIKEVFVHAQAHFRHPSLGTDVEFEVIFFAFYYSVI